MLAAPSHPPRFLCLAIRSTWGGREGQCLGRSWGSLAAGGPILLPQPSLLCRHQDFSCVPWPLAGSALQEVAAAVPSPWRFGSVTASGHDAGAQGQAGTMPWPVRPRDPLAPVLLWQTDPLLSAGKKPHP
uniref:Uncharacterized protein n=1 Tax=Buteo japonicus TaxID=224669 RepID=A0A8C0BBF8_9AVES